MLYFCVFLGIEADDTAMYNMMPHFEKTSKFIHKALSQPGKLCCSVTSTKLTKLQTHLKRCVWAYSFHRIYSYKRVTPVILPR